jgi:hypothetical protein
MTLLGMIREFIIQASTLINDAGEGAGLEFALTRAEWAIITLVSSAKAGTSPTLDTKLQYYDAASTSWIDVPNGAFEQVTDTGQSKVLIMGGPGQVIDVTGPARATDFPPLARMRLFHTIGGTSTPSITCSVGCIAREY